MPAPVALTTRRPRAVNEELVGKAVRESGVPRGEIFVTTKLWCSHFGRVRESFEESLTALGLDYIDLYLMHWPQTSIDGMFRL